MDRNSLRTRYKSFLYRSGRSLNRLCSEPIMLICDNLGLTVVPDRRNNQYLIGRSDKYMGSIPFECEQIEEAVSEIWMMSTFMLPE
jgi:hypothetical protein